MERLQAAIKKARQTRDGVSPVRVRRPSVDEKLLEAWKQLPDLLIEGRHLRRNRIVTVQAGPDAMAFDMLRTRTMRQMQVNGWSRLAITSPEPGCGKSTLLLNLAFALARQKQLRILVVEIDMRRPALANLLGTSPTAHKKSVADLLSGGAGLREVAQRHKSNLAIAMSLGPVQNASDILLGDNVGDVLNTLEERYRPDLLLFDMPPLLATDDSMAFMQHMDCALVVASAGQTSVHDIDRCEREIAVQTDVLGVILNKYRYGAQEPKVYGY